MPDEVTSYWPDDFDVKVLSPLAILRIQASALSAKTGGLLDAEVVTATSAKTASHELQLIAPALGGERRTVLTVTHAVNEPYPARLAAAVFEPDVDSYDPNEDPRPEASTVQEFKDLVKQVLQSKQVRATMQSLLARSQEVTTSASA
jgi:hypothetical protein